MKHLLSQVTNRYPFLEYFMTLFLYFAGSIILVLLLTIFIGLITNS